MREIYLDVCELSTKKTELSAGDRIFLSGTVYTARDAVHKKINSALDNGESLPFDIQNAVIYYAGPTPTPTNLAIGSCGPTTSNRMDAFTPRLMDLGLAAMIGKGNRSQKVIDSMKKNSVVYFCAIGGAGALYARCVFSCKEIAFFELGCESVKELVIKDFPLIVGIDSFGSSIFRN